MDIHNIGILINTPGNIAPIHISNTVSGQIGNFHLQCIHARTKILAHQTTIRNCNKRSYRLSVDAYTGTLTNIPEVEHPLSGIGRTLQCKRSGIASSSHHILCTFGRNFRPRTKRHTVRSGSNRRACLYKAESPFTGKRISYRRRLLHIVLHHRRPVSIFGCRNFLIRERLQDNRFTGCQLQEHFRPAIILAQPCLTGGSVHWIIKHCRTCLHSQRYPVFGIFCFQSRDEIVVSFRMRATNAA